MSPPRKMFSDMTGHWAADAASLAVAEGWMTANGNSFSPNGAVTKAQFAASLSKVIGKPYASPDGALAPSTMLFMAVDAAKKSGKNLNFAGGVEGAAAEVGQRLQLTTGPGDPAMAGATATRAQAAAMLARVDGQIMQSYAPASWRSGFHDEFDADRLNETMWYVYTDTGEEIQNARTRANVEQRGDGFLRIHHKKESVQGKPFTAGMLETRGYVQKYGYFEARIRLANVAGLDQAFWMRNRVPLNDPKHYEIDTAEAYFPNTIGTTLHQQGMQTVMKQQWVGFDFSQEFHTFSVNWGPSTIIYYLDGKEIDRKPHVKANDPGLMILSSSVMGWAGPITDKIHGKVMTVDWVRAYVMP
jgi:beta-glucanase (GH16 family)